MFSLRNEVAEPPPAPGAQSQAVPKPIRPAGTSLFLFSRARLVILVLALLAICVVVQVTFSRRTVPPQRSSLNHSGASNKDVAILRLKGTTQAIHSRAILAPMLSGQQVGTLTITKLLSAGTRVHQGNVLVEFDRQAQIRDAVDKQAEYAKLVDQVAREQQKRKRPAPRMKPSYSKRRAI